MILIAPEVPVFLKPVVANSLNPICYFIFYWTGIIISPEALVVGVSLVGTLLLLRVSAVGLFSDAASSEQR